MDFFGHQEQARKRTRLLIVLFAVAVICLTALTNLLVATLLVMENSNADSRSFSSLTVFVEQLRQQLPVELMVSISSAVLSCIGLAYLYKRLRLRSGGAAIAESLSARLVQPDSHDFYEKRLLNLVEEMAIASGMPVPPVYVLDNEIGINAFAAGFEPSDAIVAVTQGCLTKLSREQLQGVIGHEFSHILNGDMRLNMHLVALLFGILCIGILGRILLHAGTGRSQHYSAHHSNYQGVSFGGSAQKKGALPIFLLGLGLMVLGYCGVFFGRLIQAALSRQREFLADASAVQFTRNPQSVADALKVIGYGSHHGGSGIGSAIGHGKQDEYRHLFFANGSFLSNRFAFSSVTGLGVLNIFSTHPPLAQRIERIDRRWDGQWLAPQSGQLVNAEEPAKGCQNNNQENSQDNKPAHAIEPIAMALMDATGLAASGSSMNTDNMTDEAHKHNLVSVFQQLSAEAHEPFSARALVYALLLAPDTRLVREQQLTLIVQAHGDATRVKVDQLRDPVALIPDTLKLNLVEKSIAALKNLSDAQYAEFKALLIKLVQCDGQIDLFEWCLYRLLLQYLNSQFAQSRTTQRSQPKYNKAEQLAAEIAIVLSFVAHHDIEPARNFQHGLQAAGFEALPNIALRPQDNSFKHFNIALKKMTQAYPHLKGRIIKALVHCVLGNGVNSQEQNLVITIAAILECPTPDLFCG